MSIQVVDTVKVAQRAYRLAWQKFNRFADLSPDEKASGPTKLRDYIQTLVAAGERDPEKISASALGLMRQYEQIARSHARVAGPTAEP